MIDRLNSMAVNLEKEEIKEETNPMWEKLRKLKESKNK